VERLIGQAQKVVSPMVKTTIFALLSIIHVFVEIDVVAVELLS